MKAFVFPGQGSQKIGMSKDFYDNFQVAKDVFAEVDEALGRKLSSIIFGESQEELTQTQNAQPALMCASMAMLRVLEKESGKRVEKLCDFVAGHSLGEYSALCAAGAFSLSDTAKLLKVRGEAFAEAGKQGGGSMAAIIGVTIKQAEEIALRAKEGDEVCQVANDNTVGQVVISGHESAIDRSLEIAKQMGAKRAIKLPVSGAFHSALMQSAADKVKQALETVTINEPIIPVIANVSANQVFDAQEIKESLIAQVTSRVRWREIMLNLESADVKKIIEIGSGNVLKNMVGRTCEKIEAGSICSVESLKEFF